MAVIVVPKSDFKPKAFEYLRRAENGDRICITDHGRPVVDVIRHVGEGDAVLRELRGAVLRYERPAEPVDAEWEADR